MKQTSRKGLDPAEKEAREEARHVDTQTIGLILDELVRVYSSLSVLHEAIGDKSVKTLSFANGDGQEFTLTRKSLKHFDDQYVEALKSLKGFFRVANKKPKRKADPAQFKGVHNPIFVGPAITNFLTNADFGYNIPNDPSSGKLSDTLKMAKGGFLLRNTLNMLFYIYIYYHGLYADENDKSFVRADAVMDKAFGDKIPALYGLQKGGEKVKVHKKTKKETVVPINEKAENKAKSNTFSILTAAHSGSEEAAQNFDKKRFKMFFLQAMSAINIYMKDELSSIKTKDGSTIEKVLASEAYREAMLKEHNATSECSKAWEKFNAPSRNARAKKTTKKVEA